MKKGTTILLSVLIIALIAITVYAFRNTISNWVHPQDVEQTCEHTEPIEITITTADVVAQRRVEIDMMRIDSVYYTIPEPALIAILDFIGTDVSRESVVLEYKCGIQYYNGVINGATKPKHYLPDSVPISKVQIKQTPVVPDTVNK